MPIKLKTRTFAACLFLSACSLLGAANTPPQITTVQAFFGSSALVDHPTLYKLYVGDQETSAINLQLSFSSSNPVLFPTTNAVFHWFLYDADGQHWYLTLVPAFGQTGTATNTITVSDGTNSVSTNFVITVTPPPPGSARFANTSVISIPEVGAATPYPSTTTVTGMSGSITNLTLTLSKINHQYIKDVHMLLVAPSGRGMVVFSRISSVPVADITAALSDAAPDWSPLPPNFELWSEQFRPADYATNSPFLNNFPAPAPAGPYAPTLAENAFGNAFNGLSANGTWSLYIYDDGAPAQGNIVGGWSLMIGTDGVRGPTISDIPSQSTTLSTATAAIPFTISDSDTPAANLSLSGFASNPTLVPTNNIVFGGSGSNRTVTVTPATGQTGSATITITVSNGTSTASDSFVLSVGPVLAVPTSFTNTATITIPDQGAGTPYPSVINVAGMGGTISTVTVRLRNLSQTWASDVDVLLVGPGGQKVLVMSDAGSGNANNVTLTLSDAAAASLPAANLVSGTFKPTNLSDASGGGDTFPGPAPAGPYAAALSAFNGTDANGAWSLYVFDDGPGDQGSFAGGWSLTITTTGGGPALPVVTVAATDATGAEPSDPGTFTFSRTGSTAAGLTVNYTVVGTASSGSDYTSIGTTVTFGVGSATATQTVSVQNDALVEGAETVVLTLAAGSGYSVGAPAAATVTINDDDAPALPVVTVAATDAAAAEPGDPGTFTFSRTGSTAAGLTVNYTVGGTTSSGSDYTSIGTTVTFGAGSATATQTVSVLNDALVEGSETVVLTLAAGSGYSVGAPAAATVTINDDDGAVLPAVTVAATDATGAEPSDPGTFTFTRTGSTTAGLTVNYTVTGTASSGSDYTSIGTTVTFAAGSATATQTVSVLNDALVEGSETVVLTLAAGSGYSVGAPAAATVTINDDDASASPTISSIPNQTVLEGRSAGPFNFTVSDTDTPVGNLTVTGSSSNQGLVPDGNIVFFNIGGDPIRTLTLTVTPVDGVFGNSTITVNVNDGTGNITSSNFTFTVSAPPAGTVIVNSATAITVPTQAAASAYPSTMNVAGLAGTITKLTLTLKGVTHTASQDLQLLLVSPTGQKAVLMAHAGGGAINNFPVTLDDAATYPLPPSCCAILAGTYQPTDFAHSPFPLPAPGEPYGTTLATFNGESPNGNWLLYVFNDPAGTGSGSISGGWSLAITTTDGGPVLPAVTAVATDATAAEPSDPGTFTFSRTGSTAATLTVNYTVGGTASSGSDYTSIGTTVTFGVGSATATQTVSVLNDALVEGSETVVLTLAAGSGYSVGAPAAATVTIADDEVSSGGTQSFTNLATITIPDQGVGTPYPSVINVAGMGGTISTVTVRLRNLSQTWASDVDVLLVGPGGQKVLVMSDAGSGNANSVTLTLSDAAAASLPAANLVSGTFKPTNLSDASGGGDNFPAPAPAGPYAAALSAFNGSDANGAWSLYVFDDGPGDQGSFAGGWSLTITTTGGGPVLPAVTVAATDATGAEPSDPGTFTFTRTGSTTAGLTVNYTVGGTASSGSDYTSIGTTVTFAAGSATATQTVSVLNDALVEGAETVVLTLAAGSGYTVGSPAVATVTINDDDGPVLPVVTVAATDATAAEPSDPGTFTFTRTGSTTAGLTVNYTVGGTASSGSDYTSIGTTVSFAAGSATSTQTVSVLNDGLVEGFETVVLTLAAGSGYTVGAPAAATVTIADDEVSSGGTQSFTNLAAITIPDQGAATPYPSVINVAGLSGTISTVTVRLRNLSQTWASDVDVLLVGPGGQKVLVMSDAGSGNANNATLTLSDAAAASLPAANLVSGTFKPTNLSDASSGGDNFPGPAPAGPYAAALSAFNGTDANGAWSLYVFDDGPGDLGSFATGWSLTITTTGAGGRSTLSAVVAPQITMVAPDGQGGIRLNVRGQVGLSYALEASSDLVNWTKVDVQDNTTGSIEFVDQSTTNTMRFYRAVSVPE